MDNYKVIEQKLRNLEPFNGNSLRAYLEEEGSLAVYSYSTMIARAWPRNGAVAVTVWNDRKYSVTTSRHQNLIRRAWGI